MRIRVAPALVGSLVEQLEAEGFPVRQVAGPREPTRIGGGQGWHRTQGGMHLDHSLPEG